MALQMHSKTLPRAARQQAAMGVRTPAVSRPLAVRPQAMAPAAGSGSRGFHITFKDKSGATLELDLPFELSAENVAVNDVKPTEDEVRGLFTQWNNALATLNPEAVADLYAEDAVLLPTVSNKVRKTRAERVDYFQLFLTRKPQGVINESNVTIFSSTLAQHTGIYTFSLFNPADGTTSMVGARFSFTYRKDGDKWLIVEHHSSALPEPTTPKNAPSAEEVRGLFTKWNSALATLNPEAVADLYAKDAVLLPTVSNKVRTNRSEIVDYFKLFLTRKPQGVVNESHVNIFSDSLVQHTGIYTFALYNPADGSTAQVGARFSFTYRKEGDKWLIVEHHSSALPEPTTPKNLPTDEEVRGLFTLWNNALATLKPENVADLYAKDAVLLPTVSNKVRTNRAEILDYFQLFLTRKPQGVINESHVTIFSETLAQHTGIYTFDLYNPDNGSTAQVGARFSYTYRKEGDKWLIVEHHSSALPENKAAAAPVAVPPSEEQVRGLFSKWNSALATLNPEAVADLYAKDAVLLPTVSNKVRTNRSEIVDYFKLFLTRKPQGVINESHVTIFNAALAQHTGIYTFDLFNPADGTTSQVGARFSFTYRKEGENWLIVEHHSSALPEAQAGPSEADVKALFDKWNSALATLNPEAVADLYAPDAVLLPTVSNKVRTNRSEIVDYFTMFLTRKPQGVINQSHVSIYTPGLASHSGIYTFDLFNPADGTTSQVGARFSFTYKKVGSEWLIAEHHSSALPEPVAAKAAAKVAVAA